VANHKIDYLHPSKSNKYRPKHGDWPKTGGKSETDIDLGHPLQQQQKEGILPAAAAKGQSTAAEAHTAID
jgi:hypothetical protein